MPYKFSRRLDRLGRRKKQLDSRLIRYVRESSFVDIRATVSEPNRLDVFPSGSIITISTRNYCFDVADLVLDGTLTTPKQGDRIYDQNNLFEVNADGDSSVFKFTTQSRKRYRVFSKWVSNSIDTGCCE